MKQRRGVQMTTINVIRQRKHFEFLQCSLYLELYSALHCPENEQEKGMYLRRN